MSPEPASALRPEAGGRTVLLSVRVQPGARRPGARGSQDGVLRLAVSAPPLEGRANQAAQELIARLFGLRPSQVELVRGQTSRSKTFRLQLDPAAAQARLERLVAPPPEAP